MRAITYFQRTVYFPDKPEKARFFSRLQSGQWEPGTFRNIARFVDGKTTYIDIGGWIGVTPYWAAQAADNVIVVEPDPVCFGILTEMKGANTGEVKLVNAALSQDERLVLNSVGGGFGSSETSALIADDTGMTIEPRRSQFPSFRRWRGPTSLPQDRYRRLRIQGSRPVSGDRPEEDRRRAARGAPADPGRFALRACRSGVIRTASATFRLIRSLRGFRLENPSALWGAIRKSVSKGEIRGFDLLFVAR